MRERTCIICKKKDNSSAFFRIGRQKDGTLAAGKGGRGAYICRSKSCLERALAKPRISFVLRTQQNITMEKSILEAFLTEISEEEK